jgi:branched-chain amino acid transport system substrate-binding protein
LHICGSGEHAWGSVAFADETIKIGLSGAFTGSSSPRGVSMRDGVKLAVSEINKSGGVFGKQIELVERDDEANSELGVRIAQELINKEQVIATVGYVNTGVALASQRFYQEAEIAVINNVTTGTVIAKQFMPPDYKANYIFRTSANDAIQSAMIAEEATSGRALRSRQFSLIPPIAAT